MTDIEIVRRCAAKMEIALFESNGVLRVAGVGGVYWPLTDDAQCMALAKRFISSINTVDGETYAACAMPFLGQNGYGISHCVDDVKGMNRAICLALIGGL